MLKNGKIHFFTGKGGVGKSTLSLAFANQLAELGHKTLWLEFTQTPTLKHFPNLQLEHTPKLVSGSLYAASWNGEDCLQEFVKYSVKLRLIYETFYRSKAITALIKAAPALREIAFLGYLTSHLRDVKPCLKYDQIVVDAPSTGHFLSCLKVPGALLDISDFGPMGFHCNGILNVLKDPDKTSIYSVFLAEPLVVLENKYLQKELIDLGINSVPWANKVLDKTMTEELKKLDTKSSDHETQSSMKLNLISSQARQEVLLKNLKLKSNLLTFDAPNELIKIQMKDNVKQVLSV